VQINIAQHDFNSTEVDRMSSRAKIWFNLNQQQKAVQITVYIFYLNVRSKLYVQCFLGLRAYMGIPPTQMESVSTFEHESNFKKKVGRTGNSVVYRFYFFSMKLKPN
jgi:hypothetical protein